MSDSGRVFTEQELVERVWGFWSQGRTRTGLVAGWVLWCWP